MLFDDPRLGQVRGIKDSSEFFIAQELPFLNHFQRVDVWAQQRGSAECPFGTVGADLFGCRMSNDAFLQKAPEGRKL